MPAWQKFRDCFLLFKKWPLKRKFQKAAWPDEHSSEGLGRERDGLVHFYCLANSPKSPISSIIHNGTLLPSKLPPRPFFSPSKSSRCLSLLCVFPAVVSEYGCRYIKDDRPIGSHPKFPLCAAFNHLCFVFI